MKHGKNNGYIILLPPDSQRMFNPMAQTDEHLIEELAVPQNSNACLDFLSARQVSGWNRTDC
jgi:hypothetical protein